MGLSFQRWGSRIKNPSISYLKNRKTLLTTTSLPTNWPFSPLPSRNWSTECSSTPLQWRLSTLQSELHSLVSTDTAPGLLSTDPPQTCALISYHSTRLFSRPCLRVPWCSCSWLKTSSSLCEHLFLYLLLRSVKPEPSISPLAPSSCTRA